MNEKKKPYSPPKVFEVELNQDQAILTACRTGGTTISVNRATGCTTSCRRANTAGNAGPLPS